VHLDWVMERKPWFFPYGKRQLPGHDGKS